MKVLSIQCGMPREVLSHGNAVTTSIYKEPVEGRVALRTLNLDGDRQSDLSVHGGKNKAVYCYPVEHYASWRAELPGKELVAGAFGENFTVEGFSEDTLRVGDRFAVGSAEVVATQPRLPCFKLGIKFGSDEMIKRFLASGRSGFYLAVAREGEVGAADAMIPLGGEPDSISIAEFLRLYLLKEYDGASAERVRRALALQAMPDEWKPYFEEKLRRSGW